MRATPCATASSASRASNAGHAISTSSASGRSSPSARSIASSGSTTRAAPRAAASPDEAIDRVEVGCGIRGRAELGDGGEQWRVPSGGCECAGWRVAVAAAWKWSGGEGTPVLRRASSARGWHRGRMPRVRRSAASSEPRRRSARRARLARRTATRHPCRRPRSACRRRRIPIPVASVRPRCVRVAPPRRPERRGRSRRRGWPAPRRYPERCTAPSSAAPSMTLQLPMNEATNRVVGCS